VDKRLSVTVSGGNTSLASGLWVTIQELGIGCRYTPSANGAETLSIRDTH
jgi:hypothetical protein